MRILDLKLTYKCNNDCQYCCQERELRKVKSDFSKDDVQRIMEREWKLGIDKVVLTGGEPTLNEELEEIARLIRDIGVRILQLQTNARLLDDEEYLVRLIKAGVNNFAISMHGSTEDMHEAFTHTPESFQQLMNALRLINQYKMPIALNCVITKHNIKHLKEIITFVHDNNLANSLQFAFIHMTGKAKCGISDFVTISEAARAVKEACDGISYDDLNVTTEAIPFCKMYGHEKMVSELYNDAEIITYDFRERREFTKARQSLFKYKPKICEKCIFNSVCEGTWAEYAEVYGYGEFVPIKEFRRNYDEWYRRADAGRQNKLGE